MDASGDDLGAVLNELDDIPDCFGERIDCLFEQRKDPVIKKVISKLSGEVADGDVARKQVSVE